MSPGYQYGGALFFVSVAARLILGVIRLARDARDAPPVAFAAPVSAEQQARMMSMIADPPKVVEHRCPKCGTLIHADIVHGGFGPCRTCGWTPDQK
jgi:hypothetical protein